MHFFNIIILTLALFIITACDKSDLKNIDEDFSKLVDWSFGDNSIQIKETEYLNDKIRDLPETLIMIKGHKVRYNQNPKKELLNFEKGIQRIILKKKFIN